MREEIVSEQDARLVVVAGIDGVFVTPQFGFVEHVVVNKRGGMNHFDDGRKNQVIGAHPSQRLAAKQHQRRAEPLAADAKAVLDQFVDVRVGVEEQVDVVLVGVDSFLDLRDTVAGIAGDLDAAKAR